jgi:DNA-binding XRE family transcriptional regulator
VNIADRETRNTNRGENCRLSKLTNEQVREIRSLAGQLTQKEMARRYRVSRTAIGNIIRRKTWRHL